MIARALGLCVPVLIAAACAPTIVPPGPPIAPPELSAEAFRAADGVDLAVRSWGPKGGEPRAVVVALHGFNDYSNFFAQPGAFLAARGIQSYAYDQRGFGKSARPGMWPGVQAYVADLKAMVGEVRARHPSAPLYLLGESMGGAVIMVAMTGPDPPANDGLILSGPAVWGRSTMPWYQRMALWIAAHTLPWVKVTGEELEIRASDNNDMLKALGRDPLVIKETRIDAIHGMTDLMDAALESAQRLDAKALILYGEKDEVVPPEPTFLMLARRPQAAVGRQTVALYENGFHMLLRDLQAETVWLDVDAWIGDGAAALPSGADEHARKVLAKR